MTRVALDLEEVLADTIQEACRSTDKLESDDFESWDISGYTWQVYAGVSDALWRHDPISIPVVEDGLDDYTANIERAADELDIVTARMHVNGQIEKWLNYHDISYNDIVATRQPKYELDYDVYIDDNPEMFGQCRLLLRDHPHNDHLDDGSSKTTDRIQSLGQAEGFV